MAITSVNTAETAVYTEKKSVFYAYVFPAASVEIFEERLRALRTEHDSARHFLGAYRISPAVEAAFEDREPVRSAHLILDILRKNALEQVGVILVRHFGGILLGASHLEKAYMQAFKLAYGRTRKIRTLKLPVYEFEIAQRTYRQLLKLAPDVIILSTVYNGPTVVMRAVSDRLPALSDRLGITLNEPIFFQEVEITD